jgi:hypothetical protein
MENGYEYKENRNVFGIKFAKVLATQNSTINPSM